MSLPCLTGAHYLAAMMSVRAEGIVSVCSSKVYAYEFDGDQSRTTRVPKLDALWQPVLNSCSIMYLSWHTFACSETS